MYFFFNTGNNFSKVCLQMGKRLTNQLVSNLLDAGDLFYPQTCAICSGITDRRTVPVCFKCLFDLPLTEFSSWPNNRLERSFQGRLPLQAATALLYFYKKGPVQRLMHLLKYRNRQELGRYLGKWLASEMMLGRRFASVDCILPVPLHPKKLRKRGYNQVVPIGLALSEVLGIPMYTGLLTKTGETMSRTARSREERNYSIEGEYALQETDLLQGKHVLLVDDIITSGSTLEACWHSMQRVPGLRVSVASLAFTA